MIHSNYKKHIPMFHKRLGRRLIPMEDYASYYNYGWRTEAQLEKVRQNRYRREMRNIKAKGKFLSNLKLEITAHQKQLVQDVLDGKPFKMNVARGIGKAGYLK